MLWWAIKALTLYLSTYIDCLREYSSYEFCGEPHPVPDLGRLTPEVNKNAAPIHRWSYGVFPVSTVFFVYLRPPYTNSINILHTTFMQHLIAIIFLKIAINCIIIFCLFLV